MIVTYRNVYFTCDDVSNVVQYLSNYRRLPPPFFLFQIIAISEYHPFLTTPFSSDLHSAPKHSPSDRSARLLASFHAQHHSSRSRAQQPAGRPLRDLRLGSCRPPRRLRISAAAPCGHRPGVLRLARRGPSAPHHNRSANPTAGLSRHRPAPGGRDSSRDADQSVRHSTRYWRLCTQSAFPRSVFARGCHFRSARVAGPVSAWRRSGAS